MANAIEVINNDDEVKSIFINIFGGITKGDEVANGIVQALGRVEIRSPIVIRLDGTNADEGRAILAEHESDRLVSQPTMIDAARKAVEMAGARSMSIFVDETTKVVYQGLTGVAGPLLRAAQPGVRHATSSPAPTRRKRAPTSTGIPIFATVDGGGGGDGRERVVHVHSRAGRLGRSARGGRGRHRARSS